MLNGFTRAYPALKFLSAEQEESIHRGALFTLQKTGMQIEHAGALKLMADAGCGVDMEQQRARIPSWLAEECLRKVPSNFRLKARDPQNDPRARNRLAHSVHLRRAREAAPRAGKNL